ncbi:MAG: 50S ribosome-binding GTPase [candidate division WOR-3 bacterium]|nr:50S ribosome-binding GTPase [candidate division WOR-3 bacterium]
MPANLTPQYFDVEKKYREARDLREKLIYLQEMLAIIPKHKGTEKLQADLKTRISKMKETISKQKKSGGTGGAWYQVEKQGAGQIVMVGLPNSGRSSLLNSLTNAHAEVALYPFTTNLPLVGMMEYEDIKIQIVDTPPLYGEAPAWLFGLYRNGDVLLIVLDAQSNIHQDLDSIMDALNARNIFSRDVDSGDTKSSIIVLNKFDSGNQDLLKSFTTQYKEEFQIISVSTKSGEGIEGLKKLIFATLGIIRVYTKKIGHPIEKRDPVVLKVGTTVIDAAEHIHKDFRKNLKFARLWSDANYQGLRVEKNHVLTDGDVLEFHV